MNFSFLRTIGTKTIVGTAPAAGIAFGLISLWAYWSHFGIYLFDYISFADIFRYSIQNLTILAMMMLLPLGSLLIISFVGVRTPDTPKQETMEKLLLLIVGAILFVGAIIRAVAVDFLSLHGVCCVLFGLAAGGGALWDMLHVRANGWTEYGKRLFFCSVIGLIPIFSYMSGEVRAMGLLKNTRGRYVHANIFSDSELAKIYPEYKLIGKLGDYYHFCSPDNAFMFSVHETGIRYLQVFPIQQDFFSRAKYYTAPLE